VQLHSSVLLLNEVEQVLARPYLRALRYDFFRFRFTKVDTHVAAGSHLSLSVFATTLIIFTKFSSSDIF
jgi:hypothetical protein